MTDKKQHTANSNSIECCSFLNNRMLKCVFSHASCKERQWRSAGPPLWFTLKYLNNYAKDFCVPSRMNPTSATLLVIRFHTDIHDSQMLFPNGLSEPLTFYRATMRLTFLRINSDQFGDHLTFWAFPSSGL